MRSLAAQRWATLCCQHYWRKQDVFNSTIQPMESGIQEAAWAVGPPAVAAAASEDRGRAFRAVQHSRESC